MKGIFTEIGKPFGVSAGLLQETCREEFCDAGKTECGRSG